jgi:hypothetical protein
MRRALMQQWPLSEIFCCVTQPTGQLADVIDGTGLAAKTSARAVERLMIAAAKPQRPNCRLQQIVPQQNRQCARRCSRSEGEAGTIGRDRDPVVCRPGC